MSNIKEYYGKSLKGERLVNQDYFSITRNSKNFLIAIIADGMGGHRGGKIASRLTTQYALEFFKDINFSRYDDEKMEKLFYKSIQYIHKKIYEVAEARNELFDMGTTLNLNIFVRDNLYTLNVGDSRSTIVSGKKISFITVDQNLSTLAKNDSSYNIVGGSNYLLSSIGPKKKSTIDVYKTKLKNSGYIVITTDGVHNHVEERQLTEILSKQRMSVIDKCNRILKTALKNRSLDNVTCLLIEYE